MNAIYFHSGFFIRSYFSYHSSQLSKISLDVCRKIGNCTDTHSILSEIKYEEHWLINLRFCRRSRTQVKYSATGIQVYRLNEYNLKYFVFVMMITTSCLDLRLVSSFRIDAVPHWACNWGHCIHNKIPKKLNHTLIIRQWYFILADTG